MASVLTSVAHFEKRAKEVGLGDDVLRTRKRIGLNTMAKLAHLDDPLSEPASPLC